MTLLALNNWAQGFESNYSECLPSSGFINYMWIFSHYFHCFAQVLGPVVQSAVSLTSSLRVISLTVLADSIHNILIFFAEKM